jgi:hypothetical protein
MFGKEAKRLNTLIKKIQYGNNIKQEIFKPQSFSNFNYFAAISKEGSARSLASNTSF